MKAFGIEIRKANTIGTLYNDVDATLRANNILPNQVNADIQVSTVAHSLQKMFSVDKHFDVCTIRNCAETCQVCISEERMRIYRSIHCMNWSEMIPEFRTQIIAMVLDDFRSVLNPTDDVKTIEIK